MNIYALQQIMGHSDLEMLRKYLALVEEDLEDAHKKHGAVDNMI
jgi:site-specific recombinase XerD